MPFYFGKITKYLKINFINYKKWFFLASLPRRFAAGGPGPNRGAAMAKRRAKALILKRGAWSFAFIRKHYPC